MRILMCSRCKCKMRFDDDKVQITVPEYGTINLELAFVCPNKCHKAHWIEITEESVEQGGVFFEEKEHQK